MRISFAVAVVCLWATVLGEVDVKKMTAAEKDKHLACSELVSMRSQSDEKVIEETLQQDAYLKNGIKQMMKLDMMIKCVDRIDEELVGMMYVDMKRVVKMEGVREERIAFLKVNYNDYGNLTEFIYEQRHRDMLKISLALRDEMKERLKSKTEKSPEEKAKDKSKADKTDL